VSVPDVSALLQRYRPVVHYDSHESFYADSVAIMTDRVTPGWTLQPAEERGR
jgi:hypothetical protein